MHSRPEQPACELSSSDLLSPASAASAAPVKEPQAAAAVPAAQPAAAVAASGGDTTDEAAAVAKVDDKGICHNLISFEWFVFLFFSCFSP